MGTPICAGGRSIGSRIATMLVSLVVAASISPSAAHAAEWVSEFPYGTSRTAPTVVSADVFDTVGLNASTARITIDGTPYRTLVRQPERSSAGRWTQSEVLEGDYYVTHWYWSSDAGAGRSQLLASTSPRSSMLRRSSSSGRS